jgi:SAM-dependent methyltransferase
MGESVSRVKRLLLRLLGQLGLLRTAFSAYEWLASLRASSRSSGRADDGLPVPPPRLIMRVAGTTDLDWFLQGGRLAADGIRSAVTRHRTQVEELRALLDFGCGCGRVLRTWASLDGTLVAGSDTNRDAVDWCRHNLPFAELATNGLRPPLAFADDRFDLVYALSVFTHLPEELQRPWLLELVRVLAPGGLVLLSTHGETYASRLDPEERARFESGHLVVRWEQAAGTNLCAAYHPSTYVRERLAAELELLEHLPEGAQGNPHQDLYVFRAP